MSQGAPGSFKVGLIPLFGVAGSVVVVAGMFLPALIPPSGRTGESFYAYDPNNGKALLILAALSFILTWVFQWYRGLWFTGLGALALIALTAARLQREAKGFAVDWLVIGSGAVLLVAAALLAEVLWRRQQAGAGTDQVHSIPEDE